MNPSWFWIPAFLWSCNVVLYATVPNRWMNLVAPVCAFIAWRYTVAARAQRPGGRNG